MKQKFKSISLSETLKNRIDSRMREMGLKTYTEVLELFLEGTESNDTFNVISETNWFTDLENIQF